MGARTQMIIEVVNHDNSRKVKAYHFQWGAGRPMFMALNQFLTKLSLVAGNVEKLSDALKHFDALGFGDDMEYDIRQDMAYCTDGIKHLKEILNSHPDHLMRNSYLDDVNCKTRWLRNSRRVLRDIRNLSMDDMQSLRKFLEYCDNNNGVMYVRFTAIKWTSDYKEWDVELMIIPGAEDTGLSVHLNHPVTPREYMRRYPICTDEFIAMVESTLAYWEVKIITHESGLQH